MQRKEKVILPFTIIISVFGFLAGRFMIPWLFFVKPERVFGTDAIPYLEYAIQGGIPVLDKTFDITLSILIVVLAVIAWIGVPVLMFLITKRISIKRRIAYMYFVCTSYAMISAELTNSAINYFT